MSNTNSEFIKNCDKYLRSNSLWIHLRIWNKILAKDLYWIRFGNATDDWSKLSGAHYKWTSMNMIKKWTIVNMLDIYPNRELGNKEMYAPIWIYVWSKHKWEQKTHLFYVVEKWEDNLLSLYRVRDYLLDKKKDIWTISAT